MARQRIAPITPDRFLELESKHGELYALETDMGAFFARMPTRPELDRATKQVKDGKLIDGNEQLSRACIVYPDAPETQRLFERYPLLSAETGEALVRISQGKVDPAEKPQGPCTPAPVQAT